MAHTWRPGAHQLTAAAGVPSPPRIPALKNMAESSEISGSVNITDHDVKRRAESGPFHTVSGTEHIVQTPVTSCGQSACLCEVKFHT